MRRPERRGKIKIKKGQSLHRPSVRSEPGQTHVTDALTDLEGFNANAHCALARGPPGQRQGTATVSMAVGVVRRAVSDLARWAAHPADGGRFEEAFPARLAQFRCV